MTELEIEQLERKVTWSDTVIAQETRSVEAFPDRAGKEQKSRLLV